MPTVAQAVIWANSGKTAFVPGPRRFAGRSAIESGVQMGELELCATLLVHGQASLCIAAINSFLSLPLLFPSAVFGLSFPASVGGSRLISATTCLNGFAFSRFSLPIAGSLFLKFAHLVG